MRNLEAFDWNDLRYFLAVSRQGSALGAAKRLGVNPSTVQRRLVELETHLGYALVERHALGYRLTEFGKDLLPLAEGVENSIAALRRRIGAFEKELRGAIRLTCSTAVAHRLMKSGILDSFHVQHPGLTVELLMTERFLDLAKGEADVAIRGGRQGDDALVGRKVADVPWGLYASRGYLARRGAPDALGNFQGHSIIEFIGEIGELKAAHWLRSKATKATVSGQSSNVPSVLLAIKSGVGIAPLPAPLAEGDPELSCVIGPIAELSYPTYLLTHRDLRKVPRIDAFFEFCATELRPVLTGVFKVKSSR